MENKAIRTHAKKHGVKIWEIAEALGVAESTLCRHLRRELPEQKQAEILSVIDEIAANKKAVV
ncbi:MAG: hypothetical protein ACI3V0_08555 [Faecousia sp.]